MKKTGDLLLVRALSTATDSMSVAVRRVFSIKQFFSKDLLHPNQLKGDHDLREKYPYPVGPWPHLQYREIPVPINLRDWLIALVANDI
jgi:hypothetical protein